MCQYNGRNLKVVKWSGNEELNITIEDETIVVKKEKRKNIKELFAEFDGEYISEDIDWGKLEGKEDI